MAGTKLTDKYLDNLTLKLAKVGVCFFNANGGYHIGFVERGGALTQAQIDEIKASKPASLETEIKTSRDMFKGKKPIKPKHKVKSETVIVPMMTPKGMEDVKAASYESLTRGKSSKELPKGWEKPRGLSKR
jgi:hypothetical protein